MTRIRVGAFLGRHTPSCRDLCIVFKERGVLALNREKKVIAADSGSMGKSVI